MMKKQMGLSLIELMIAITLGLLLMAGVVQMFLASKSVFNAQQGISRSQETGRLAIDFLGRDVRMAGFYGCFTPSIKNGVLGNSALSISGLHSRFDEGIIGYDNVAGLPNGAAADLGVSAAVASNNNSILVTRGANKTGLIINAANTISIVSGYTLNTSVVSGCIGNLCVNEAAVATDCIKSRVFKISGLSLAGTTLSVTHPDSWGGNPSLPLEYYDTGEILPMNTNVYFVAKGAGGNNSLWVKTNSQPSSELLEGVERFVAYYATDDNNFRLAAAINANEWPEVQSVRVEFLVKSTSANVVNEPQPYTFGGVKTTPPATDLHMYQVFSSTFAIRSRVQFK